MDSLEMVQIALAPVVEQRDELQKLNDEAGKRIAELEAELKCYTESPVAIAALEVSRHHCERANKAEAKEENAHAQWMKMDGAWKEQLHRAEKAESAHLEQVKRADEQMERCMKAEAEEEAAMNRLHQVAEALSAPGGSVLDCANHIRSELDALEKCLKKAEARLKRFDAEYKKIEVAVFDGGQVGETPGDSLIRLFQKAEAERDKALEVCRAITDLLHNESIAKEMIGNLSNETNVKLTLINTSARGVLGDD